VCKYGEKCQFAHGFAELRTVNRHPKYKTDMCRTYHSVGFCPYGPRCHFIHSLDEMRSAPVSPDRKSGGGGNNGGGPIKQLPMFGGGGSQQEDNSLWNSSSSTSDSNMKSAVAQLNNFFNMSGGGGGSVGGRSAGLLSSVDSSRSGSFCSDLMESHSPASGSPPPSAQSSLCTSPIDVSRSLRLPIFNRLA
jgi:hypothetical protein